MKPVLGEDGHRHFFGQEIEGVRNGRLPAERFDGEIQTSLPRHRRRPGPGSVHDLPGRNVAAGGTHRRDPARPVQLEIRTLHAVLEPHAKPCGALDVAAQDLHRPDKAVGRAEDTADEPVGTDRWVDLLYFRRRQLSQLLEPGCPLNVLRGPQGVELLPIAREEEIPIREVAGVHAEILLKAQELLAREQREPDVYLGAELGAEAAGGPARATPSGLSVTLEHEDTLATLLREVVGNARPDHPGADDHYLGRPHGCTRSGLAVLMRPPRAWRECSGGRIPRRLSSLCTSRAATIAAKCSPSLTPAGSRGGGTTRPFSGSGPARPSNRTPWAPLAARC